MNDAFVVAHVSPGRWLNRIDPRLKIAWLIAVSLIAVAVDSFGELTALCVLTAAPLVGLRLSLRATGVVSSLVALSLWTTVMSQGVFYQGEPRTVIVSLPWLELSAQGMFYGLQQGLRFVAGVLAGIVIVLSTSPERLLAAMVWLRVPSALGFVVVSSLRWLPTMIDEWASLRRARRLRDGNVRSGWLATWLGELRLLAPLVAANMRRAATLATSVTARGFVPGAQRTFYPPLQMRRGEQLAVVLLGLLTAAICYLKWQALG